MVKNYGFEIDEQMEWFEIKKKVMEIMRENGVLVGKQFYMEILLILCFEIKILVLSGGVIY